MYRATRTMQFCKISSQSISPVDVLYMFKIIAQSINEENDDNDDCDIDGETMITTIIQYSITYSLKDIHRVPVLSLVEFSASRQYSEYITIPIHPLVPSYLLLEIPALYLLVLWFYRQHDETCDIWYGFRFGYSKYRSKIRYQLISRINWVAQSVAVPGTTLEYRYES